MKTPSSSPKKLSDLHVLAIVGAVIAVMMFVLPLVLGYVVYLRSGLLGNPVSSDIVLREDEPLGEKGSRCGGNAHLPCRPGLACSAMAPSVGTCVEDTSSPIVFPQLNATCLTTDAPSCAPGLVCDVAQGASGICQPSTETSPHVVSSRLEGLQPTQGGYSGVPGTEFTVHVQTLNAKSLSIQLLVNGKKETVSATESEGGVWEAKLKTPASNGDLVITAIGEDGLDRSSLVVRVAPTEEIR